MFLNSIVVLPPIPEDAEYSDECNSDSSSYYNSSLSQHSSSRSSRSVIAHPPLQQLWRHNHVKSHKSSFASSYSYSKQCRNVMGSSHILSLLSMINETHHKDGLLPLIIFNFLCQVSQWHANEMLSQAQVFHSVSSVKELQSILQSSKMGKNVHSWNNLCQMHQATMNTDSNLCHNLMSSKFMEIGIGLSISAVDGTLYLCQVFQCN